MLVEPATVRAAPLPGYSRVAAKIIYARHQDRREELWFDVPEACAGEVSVNGNAWLMALLPLAFSSREPLEIALPVDRVLWQNATELMRVWSRWFPELKPVEIRAKFTEAAAMAGGRGTGLFFTGGVDSFFSLLHHDAAAQAQADAAARPIDDLIYVGGYDIPIQNRAALEQKHKTLAETARLLGKNLVVMRTNLRETRVGGLDWGKIMHGPALGAAALLLEPRFARVLISTSAMKQDAEAWGTHHLTDERMSTGSLRFVRYGGDAGRFEKTELVSQSEVALRHLHVCWADGSDRNCGRCEKCLRTLIAFELLGARDRAVCFPPGQFFLHSLRSVRLKTPLLFPLIEELKTQAVQRGRLDVAAELAACLARSRRANAFAAPFGFLRRIEQRVRHWRKGLLPAKREGTKP